MRSPMSHRIVPLLILCLSASPAFAEDEKAEDNVDPKTVTTGSIYLKSKAEYPGCQIDGAACDTQYDGSGTTVILDGIDRTKPHVVIITPIEPTLGPATIKVVPKDFKLKKLSKTERAWRAVKKLRLPKKKAEKAPPEDDQGEPEGEKKPAPEGDDDD